MEKVIQTGPKYRYTRKLTVFCVVSIIMSFIALAGLGGFTFAASFTWNAGMGYSWWNIQFYSELIATIYIVLAVVYAGLFIAFMLLGKNVTYRTFNLKALWKQNLIIFCIAEGLALVAILLMYIIGATGMHPSMAFTFLVMGVELLAMIAFIILTCKTTACRARIRVIKPTEDVHENQ